MSINLKDCFCVSDIFEALTQMQSVGAALVPGMLQELFRVALMEEITLLPFARANEKVGVVRQSFEYCAFLHAISDRPHLEKLRQATQALVQSAGATDWLASDTAIQKYQEDGSIDGHKDPSWHLTVIVIWNVTGSCLFEVLAEREHSIMKSVKPQPGDLLLLRASDGLGDPGKRRPFHRVSTIAGHGERISVIIRHNTVPEKPIPGVVYTNAR